MYFRIEILVAYDKKYGTSLYYSIKILLVQNPRNDYLWNLISIVLSIRFANERRYSASRTKKKCIPRTSNITRPRIRCKAVLSRVQIHLLTGEVTFEGIALVNSANWIAPIKEQEQFSLGCSPCSMNTFVCRRHRHSPLRSTPHRTFYPVH